MPPVRDASTKPSAATVLPAPVACSNQKRLAALGSSARLGGDRPRRGSRPVERLLVGVLVLAQLLGQLLLAREARRRELDAARRRPAPLRAPVAVAAAPRPAARSACRTARRPGGRRARCRRRAPARPGRAGGRGRAAATSGGASAVEGTLAPSSSSASASSSARRRGRARRERGRGVLALEQEGLAGERARPLEVVGRWKGCGREGRCLRLSHEGSTNRRKGKSRGPPHDFEQPGPQWGGVVWSACPGSTPYSSRLQRRRRPICHRMSRCDGLRPSSPGSRWSPCWSSA